MTVIDINALVTTIGDFTALGHLDLTVDAGAVRGFLGPNGAENSTTPLSQRFSIR